MNKHVVAAIVFDQVNALDVTGPLEAFAAASSDGKHLYQCEVWGTNDRVRSESGVGLCTDRLIDQECFADTLIIPGGRGIRNPNTLSELSSWLLEHAHRFERIASVCTGVYALAEAGLLEDRVVTTHWAFSDLFQKRYPNIRMKSDALFVRDGKFYSSGGIAAGIDLALEMIDADNGSEVAMKVARELVVFLRRTGSQEQFSEPLKVQSRQVDRLDGLGQWITNNLHADLSVEALAQRCQLSARQLTRRFSIEFGCPPAKYVKQLRLDAARSLLVKGVLYSEVAQAVGFLSLDGFRRAFENKFGVSPVEYQRRFNGY